MDTSLRVRYYLLTIFSLVAIILLAYIVLLDEVPDDIYSSNNESRSLHEAEESWIEAEPEAYQEYLADIPDPESVSLSVEEERSWKTYTNSKYGFSFRYPGEGYGIGSARVGGEDREATGEPIPVWQDMPAVWVDDLSQTELSDELGIFPFLVFISEREKDIVSDLCPGEIEKGEAITADCVELLGNYAARYIHMTEGYVTTSYTIHRDDIEYLIVWRDHGQIGEKILSTLEIRD